ncbi:MAG: YqjF family protein [Thermomicrobiales bacterium]
MTATREGIPLVDWEQIAREAGNRPWPAPQRPWVFAQVWENLLFAHWRVPFDLLRRKVPQALTLETFDGDAWVGVVPFHLRYLGPGRGRKRFSLDFLELNVRTYVSAEDKPGVWFFSLDAASLPAVIGARVGFHLPYFWADISMKTQDERVEFTSRRRHPGPAPAYVHGIYEPTGEVFRSAPGSLEEWLTERYCFYSQDRAGRLYRGEIAHARWPLQPAEAILDVGSLARAQGLDLTGPPLLHFSRRLEMVTWGPTRIETSRPR